MSYDLLNEKWIQTNEGEKGLKECLLAPRNVSALSGNPAENLSLIRLMLVILRRSLVFDVNNEKWLDVWERGFDNDRVSSYLDNWKQHFDLFGDSPFFQFSEGDICGKGLKMIVNKAPSVLGFCQDNNSLLFSKPAQKVDLPTISRWLLAYQSFAAGGGNKGRYGAGPLTKNVSMIFSGKSLFETLFFNLMHSLKPGPSELPFWEKRTFQMGQEIYPSSPAEWFTWTSRFIRVENDGSVVTNIRYAPGHKFAKDNKAWDPMTCLAQNKNKKKFTLAADGSIAAWRLLRWAVFPDTQGSQVESLRLLFGAGLKCKQMMFKACGFEKAGHAAKQNAIFFRSCRINASIFDHETSARYADLVLLAEMVANIIREIGEDAVSSYWAEIDYEGRRMACEPSSFDVDKWSSFLLSVVEDRVGKVVGSQPSMATKAIGVLAKTKGLIKKHGRQKRQRDC